MTKRQLHIVNEVNPVFGVCERCNARFSSFSANAEKAEKEVWSAFEAHDCMAPAPADFKIHTRNRPM